MRLAISNIAWDIAEDEFITSLLERFSIDAIDIAPGKYFPEPSQATYEDIAHIKYWWLERGIEITGMQALMFGTTGLNLFAAPHIQKAMLQHLADVCRIGAGLGATRLVFGSPRNRDRTGLDDQHALDVAVPFFHQLGNIAQSYGVEFCLEPNPSCYGANFMTNSLETALVVEEVAHPNIKMQFDTGALAINGEDPAVVLENFAHLIGHIHASEPNLVPLGDGATDHGNVFASLSRYLPYRLVSIEMLATTKESHKVSIARALSVAVNIYREG